MTDFLIDFQDTEVSTYFPILGQKTTSQNDLNSLIPMLEIGVEQNVYTSEMNSRARKVEDDKKTNFNNVASFDLKDLSTNVQEVVNELLEAPTKANPKTIIKAIEDKVTLNYPKFEIGVKIDAAAEEGLAVVLNIRERESNKQVKFEQIPFFVIETPSEGSDNVNKKETPFIYLFIAQLFIYVPLYILSYCY